MPTIDRILTTHVGSLPRDEMVCDVIAQKEAGTLPHHDLGADVGANVGADAGEDLFDAVIGEAVDSVVAKQIHAGIDIVSDGEFSKIGYANYIKDRLSGFSGKADRLISADLEDFPGYTTKLNARRSAAIRFHRPVCTGPVAVVNRKPLEDDIRRMKAAVMAHAPHRAFMTAASPGVIAIFQPNKYYPTHAAYLEALSLAMRDEYHAIIDAGFDLQIDCPDLGMGRHTIFKNQSETAFLRHAEEQVEALNAALVGLPPDRLRMHVCWGNYEGPHHHDIALEKILPVVLKAAPTRLLIESANPRHAHEWAVFKAIRIPDDKVLVPGVIDSTSNYIEHPDLVAERICRFADIVGRERVIAGTDCGFSTFAGDGLVDPAICFAKLEALSEGARRATKRLWGRA
jgi:5-methyltetrahydropteroyltriglutamate--homocysteine methyltransferase